ncbi:dienelactone hydrolase family protein [Arenibaculum pallidiluteum]|uniref:dienelactone hydrolase family protein n=1 Tax=Arenibaculum pallidiluteum TaxID=2812559 RepID=UPI001A976A66|nr:dienelactone hydrolase family protein [Arenibaculum pallidiluteum]
MSRSRLPAALSAFLLLAACETAGPAKPSASAVQQPAAGAIRESVESADPVDFADLLAARGEKRSIDTELYLPPGASGPLPLVLIAHGDEGITDRERMYAGELMRAGFAAAILDSLKPRGDESALSIAAQLNDLAAAYRKFGSDARFDRRRIGVLGFSRGGTAAYLAAHSPFIRAVAGGDARFAALMPVYPDCRWRIEKVQAAAVPMLFLFAEKDDWTPSEACLPVAVALTAAGNAVASKRYANTYHGFDMAPIEVRQRPEVKHVGDCLHAIAPSGETALEGKNLPKGSVVLRGDFKAYRAAAEQRCGKSGVTTGAQLDWRGNTTTDAVGFFTESLKNGRAVVGSTS